MATITITFYDSDDNVIGFARGPAMPGADYWSISISEDKPATEDDINPAIIPCLR